MGQLITDLKIELGSSFAMLVSEFSEFSEFCKNQGDSIAMLTNELLIPNIFRSLKGLFSFFRSALLQISAHSSEVTS